MSFDKKWEELHQELEWGKYPSEEVVRFVARNYYKEDRKHIKILDMGCGAGAQSWYLAREGFNVYGFDGSKSAIIKAEKYLEKQNLTANFYVMDATNLQFSKDFFDGIIDGAMIYANKISDIKKILNETYRILKVGGKFFSTGLFSCEMTGFGTGEKIEENTFYQVTEGALTNRGTVHFFSKEEIVQLWNECGFSKVEIDYMDRSDHGGEDIVKYFMVQASK